MTRSISIDIKFQDSTNPLNIMFGLTDLDKIEHEHILNQT